MCHASAYDFRNTNLKEQGAQGAPGTKVFQGVYFWKLVHAYLVDWCTDLTDCDLDLKCLRKMGLRALLSGRLFA